MISLITKQSSASIWNTNDDPTMQAFIDGSFSGTPDPIMVFGHPVLGMFLSLFYKLLPAIPWYPVFLTTITALALSIVIVLCRNPMSKIFSITLAISIIIRATQNPSFSISACVVIACALWIAARSIEANDKNLFVISSSLLITGVMIRSETFFLAFLIISPIFFWVILFPHSYTRRKLLISCSLALAVFFAFQVIANQTKFLCVSNQDCANWKTYSEYNQIRGDFQGSSRIDYLSNELESMNWSKNDFALFKHFNNPDTEVFGLESLIKADQATKKISPLFDFIKDPINAFRTAFASIEGVSVSLLKGFVASFLALFITVISRRKFKISLLLLMAPLSFWITISIASGIRLPERILIPATYTFALTLLWFFEKIFTEEVRITRKHAPPKRSGDYAAKIVLAIFVAGIFGASFHSKYDFFYLNRVHSEQISRSESAILILRTTSDVKPIVASGSTANILLADPWVTSRSNFDNRVMFLGWPTFSPQFYQRKSNLGMNNLFLDIANGKSRYYGCTDYKDSDAVKTYLQEHYGIKGKFKVYEQPTQTCAIYEFLKSP